MKNLLCLFFLLCSAGALHAQNSLAAMVKAYEQAGYHGSILVAKGNRILYQGGYGIADQVTKRKNMAETPYKTESIGKMLTATLVMQEVEKGTLSLDDSLGHFFPGVYPNGHLIKVRHLLSHTSGITETELNPKYRPGGNYSRADILAFRAGAPLAFAQPGQGFRYSNLGFTLLADILEKINGKPFNQLMRERIFAVSGMAHTGHPSDSTVNKLAARPYLWVSSRRFMEETRTVGKYANASGGWMSTVHDFYRYMLDVQQGTHLSKESFALMQQGNGGGMEFQPGYWYTFGLNRANTGAEGRPIYGHTGGGGGYACDMYLEPQSGYIVINFMNMYGDGRPMTKNIFNWLLKQPLDPIEKWRDIALGDRIEQQGLAYFAQHYKEELTALNMLPKTAGGYNRLAGSFDNINDQATREMLLLAGLNEFPQAGQLWLNLGRSLVKQNRLPAAKQALDKALKIALSTKDAPLQAAAQRDLDGLGKTG